MMMQKDFKQQNSTLKLVMNKIVACLKAVARVFVFGGFAYVLSPVNPLFIIAEGGTEMGETSTAS